MNTLWSVANQSVDDYVVIVVGNKPPSFELPEKVEFVQVNFPPPPSENGPHTPLDRFVWDKGTKIGIGLAHARRFSPDFVMIFDADDFVHRDIARFTADSSEPNGWVITRGYVYSRSRAVYRHQDNFNRTCGTCHIVAYSVYQVPDLRTTASQAEVAEAFGEKLYRVLGAHRHAAEWLAERGVTLSEMPFRAAVYHVDTGENHSGKRLQGVGLPVRSRKAREFGLPVTALTPRYFLSAVGPVPVSQTLRGSFRRQMRWLGGLRFTLRKARR